MTGAKPGYALGSDEAEIARLDAQAAAIALQAYFSPESGHGPAMITGVVRSLAAQIVGQGIASEQELGLASLEERMRQQVTAANAVVLPPALVGAWSRAPG